MLFYGDGLVIEIYMKMLSILYFIYQKSNIFFNIMDKDKFLKIRNNTNSL